MKRIYLIDCPGVVPHATTDTEADIVLKGVCRVENISSPQDHIPELLSRVQSRYLIRTYGPSVRDYTSAEDFLERLAKSSGRLLKGGEPDLKTAAKMVLHDWLKGKIPYFTKPPGFKEEEDLAAVDEKIQTFEEKGDDTIDNESDSEEGEKGEGEGEESTSATTY